jgi:hypothetical protein
MAHEREIADYWQANPIGDTQIGTSGAGFYGICGLSSSRNRGEAIA